MPHGAGKEYVVTIPGYEGVELWRLIAGPAATSQDFASNQSLEKIRRWSETAGWAESVIDYRGISAFDRFDRAVATARKVSAILRRKRMPPRWTNVARFEVSGHEGEAVARTGRRGHVTVWAEPDALVSRVAEVRSIPLEEAVE
ncbi:MAG: hypothetical protein WD276_09305 [Actinomycetota bacterium]